MPGNEAEISSLETKVSSLEADREEWRRDYAILSDYQEEVIRLIVIAENSQSTVLALKNSVNNLLDNSDYLKDVPYLYDCVNFEGFFESGSPFKKFDSTNSDYISLLKGTVANIDSLKEEVATSINRINNEIDDINDEIAILVGPPAPQPGPPPIMP